MKLKELSLRFLTFLTVLISAIVVLQMVPTTVSAATFTDGDGHQYIYSDNGDGTATITGFVKGGSDIAVIPDTIDDLTVTFIGDNAFEYKELTGVTLPSGLEYIGDNAFFCSQLTNITIPQSVVSIGDNAFVFQNNEEGEKTLTEVIFEEGSQLETIGDSAFRANRIQSLTIPDSVLTIGEDAFKENNISSLTIGENITSISEGAFSVNEIESLTIPESVTNIGSWAFEYNFLTEVETPTNVANIGNSAFYNNQLTSVAILNPGLIFRNNVFASNPE